MSVAADLHAICATNGAPYCGLCRSRGVRRLSQMVLSLSWCALFISGSAFAAPDDREVNDAINAAKNAQVTSQNNNERLIALTGQIQSINEELSGQRANLGRLQAELVGQREDNDAFRRSLLNELKALRRQNQSLLDSLYEQRMILTPDEATEIKPLRNYDLQTPDGKMYLGEDEYIYIKEADATFDARIDTGAAVSSISAKNITEFERNGKRWYRFTIEANDQKFEVEAPYVRTSHIRQSSKSTITERVVVSLNLKIGSFSTKSEFTLTDRTHMQYPLLIGRTLIQDIAVVDVARDHIQGRNEDTFLILNQDDYAAAMKAGKDPNAAFKQKHASMAGQIARPSSSYGANLGTNSENALPVVRTQLNAAPDHKDGSAPNPAPTATLEVAADKAATPAEAAAGAAAGAANAALSADGAAAAAAAPDAEDAAPAPAVIEDDADSDD